MFLFSRLVTLERDFPSTVYIVYVCLYAYTRCNVLYLSLIDLSLSPSAQVHDTETGAIIYELADSADG